MLVYCGLRGASLMVCRSLCVTVKVDMHGTLETGP